MSRSESHDGSGLDPVEDFLAELASYADAGAPTPSAELAALLDPNAGTEDASPSQAPVDLAARRRRRRIAGGATAIALLASGTGWGAAVAGSSDVHRVIGGITQVLSGRTSPDQESRGSQVTARKSPGRAVPPPATPYSSPVPAVRLPGQPRPVAAAQPRPQVPAEAPAGGHEAPDVVHDGAAPQEARPHPQDARPSSTPADAAEQQDAAATPKPEPLTAPGHDSGDDDPHASAPVTTASAHDDSGSAGQGDDADSASSDSDHNRETGAATARDSSSAAPAADRGRHVVRRHTGG